MKWVLRYVSLGCVLLAAGARGQTQATEREATAPASATAVATNLSFSASARSQRAAWQQRLTLGPGDSINISLFEMADTTQTEVPVGPDGRISFLQVRDFMAAGLSIDELRAKLDEALGPYYQNPRTIVT